MTGTEVAAIIGASSSPVIVLGGVLSVHRSLTRTAQRTARLDRVADIVDKELDGGANSVRSIVRDCREQIAALAALVAQMRGDNQEDEEARHQFEAVYNVRHSEVRERLAGIESVLRERTPVIERAREHLRSADD